MESMGFNGWNCVRLANQEMELVITRDVGPRIIRCGFLGASNLFAEIPGEQGGQGEAEWMLRGGHRFWIAPESKTWSYEPDNEPYETMEAMPHGVRVRQKAGPVTHIAKQMEIALDPVANRVDVTHTLINRGTAPVVCAPWALSVMGPNGQSILPLPARISHTDRLLPNQNWSLWGYTDLTDPRWTIGSRYLFFRQDPGRGPSKLGLAHREQWAAYQREDFLFVKYFERREGASYPEGDCNYETFATEQILEMETLGPLTTLQPGGTVSHRETWKLFRDIPRCRSEADVDRLIRPLV